MEIRDKLKTIERILKNIDDHVYEYESLEEANESMKYISDDILSCIDCIEDLVEDEVETVNIPDENLKEIINRTLNQPLSAEVTREQMESLVELEAEGQGIEVLDGLEYAINLERLDLSENSIEDIEVLKNLKYLETLLLSFNNIKNIDILKSLPQLAILNLEYNCICDFSVLSHVEKLESLNIMDNPINTIPLNLFNRKQLEIVWRLS